VEQVQAADGHWQSTSYVLPSLHDSLADVSQGGGPPSGSTPPLLPPTPLLMQTLGAGASIVSVASTGSSPELLPLVVPELLPLVLPEGLPEELPVRGPPELLLDPGPPSAPPVVCPPHAKTSAGTASRRNAR
jgi:hypothetical protein